MAGFQTTNTQYLSRANLYSRELKMQLEDELNAMKLVKIIRDFPDGNTFNIPSLGQADSADYVEGQAVKYSTMDTGNFTFSFDQYKYSAHAMTEKFKRDSFWAPDVMAAFVPKQHRALMEAVETRILNRLNASQTSANLNSINNAAHRWVGQGTSNSIALIDFARATNSLFKANVPLSSLCAVVDPSVAYTLQTQTNLVNFISPNQKWANVVNTGAVTGFRFMFNVYGFDIYISNYLPNGISETVNSVSVTNGVSNFFMSTASEDLLTCVGGFRQMPTVYSEFNKDLQQEEYLTIAEYGFKGGYRPENLITVLTDTTIVS